MDQIWGFSSSYENCNILLYPRRDHHHRCENLKFHIMKINLINMIAFLHLKWNINSLTICASYFKTVIFFLLPKSLVFKNMWGGGGMIILCLYKDNKLLNW
jgi:hypothetical protein